MPLIIHRLHSLAVTSLWTQIGFHRWWRITIGTNKIVLFPTQKHRCTSKRNATRDLPPIWCKLKFIYSENATKCCKISTLLLFYVAPVKSKVKILKNLVAFSEYMNFKSLFILLAIIPNFKTHHSKTFGLNPILSKIVWQFVKSRKVNYM